MSAGRGVTPAAALELRKLPRTDELLAVARGAGLVDLLGHGWVVEAIREALDGIRRDVLLGAPCPPSEEIERSVLSRLREGAHLSLRPVVNATGVVLHTNLGRSPLSSAALEAMAAAARGYANLEYDLIAGARGDRYGHAQAALCRLTGAEAALVVNNNAAAVMLALAGLSEGGDPPAEVIVSRGQLLEIGGGFRIPDVLRRSGAALVEVGTTNRTYLADYERAIGDRTRILLHVHRSNFRLTGFVHDVELKELVRLAREHGLFVVDDLGSGTLLDPARFGLPPEPTVPERIRTGADLVTFSGDKLLGGPQAGIIAGRRDSIERARRHPLLRALRVDKVTLAGLSATLAHYERGEAAEKVPVWRAIARTPEALRLRAESWRTAAGEKGARCEVIPGSSAVGGGSLPGATLPTALLALPAGGAESRLAQMRRCDPPVVARIEEDRVVLDPRTVLEGEDEAVVAAVREAVS